MNTKPDPSLFVIFGGTGDLSRRKLLPALCRLFAQYKLDGVLRVLGVSTDTSLDDNVYRDLALRALVDAGLDKAHIDSFLEVVHFQAIGKGTTQDFEELAKRAKALCEEHGLPENFAFYLALPPAAMPATLAGLDEAGLGKPEGWSRVVIEKPFGRDLKSARELNHAVHQHFAEHQVYRIDHYLGKETVQNLLVFRFANSIFESLWNRDRVDSVELIVAEELGVGTRAKYYDSSGALRDIVQNHLTQLLTLVAMDVPTAFDANSIRYEKIKVLRSIDPLTPNDIVRGRYAAGEIDGKSVVGYLDEPGIGPDSDTETFAALRVYVNTWRWTGVPFYLRTGKRMKQRLTQIVVRFRDAPVSLFKSAGVQMDTADVLVLTLQPDEGFSLHFDVKRPGSPFKLERIPLSFRYADMFDGMPEAYETLLNDVLRGDQTLFVHADEVIESWRLYDEVLAHSSPIHPYAAGSWGPHEAECFSVPETGAWR